MRHALVKPTVALGLAGILCEWTHGISRRGRAIMRWSGMGVMIGAVAVTGAIAAVVVVDGLAEHSPSSARAAVVPPSSDRVQAQANRVFESFAGSVFQRDASMVLQAWKSNGAMDGCMEREGFPEWDWSATRNLTPRTNALGASTFFAAPMALAQSAAIADTAEAAAMEHELLTMELSPAEDAAVGRCLDSAPALPETQAAQFSTPKTVSGLRDKWWAMLDSWDKEHGDTDRYNACFAKQRDAQGLSSEVTGETWRGFVASEAPRPRSSSKTPAGPFTEGAEWAALESLETTLELVDWNCRQAVYTEHLADIEDDIAEFGRDHASEISSAQQDWPSVEERAAELGFTGQRGSLELRASRSAGAR